MPARSPGACSGTMLYVSVEGGAGQLVISGPMELLRELLMSVGAPDERTHEPEGQAPLTVVDVQTEPVR